MFTFQLAEAAVLLTELRQKCVSAGLWKMIPVNGT